MVFKANGRNVKDYAARISSYAGRRSIERLQRSVHLEDILAGTTCSPISLQDFELYLAYRELSLGNLQFVVWYLDYRSRFFKLPLDLQTQSPNPAVLVPGFGSSPGFEPSAAADQDTSSWGAWLSRRRHNARSAAGKVEIGEGGGTYPSTPMSLTPKTQMDMSYPPNVSDAKASYETSERYSGPQPTPDPSNLNEADRSMNSVSPSKQPFRDETLRVVATFMRPGGTAKKELTLSGDVKEEVFRALALTTHPNVFQKAYEEVYDNLDASARSFIAQQTTNINLPKQIVWYLLGTTMTLFSISLAGLIIVMVPVRHAHHGPMRRAARLVVTPFAYLGVIAFYIAWRGFCSQIYGRSAAQLKAWELEDPRGVGVRMRKTKVGRERKRSRRRQREGSADNAAGGAGDFDDVKARGDDVDASRSVSVQELGYGDQKADLSYPVTSPRRRSDVTTEATVISPLASARPPSSLDPHGGLSLDAQDHGATDDSWPSRSKSVTIDTSDARATLAERQTTDEPTHEIVFTRPKRVAMVDIGFLRPPVFGPERIIVDERIRKYHEDILTSVVWVAVIYTSIFVAVVLSLPGPS